MPFPVELYTSQLWVIIKKHVQTPPEEKMRFASKPQQTLKEIAVKKISFRHNNSNWHVQAKHSSWPLTGLEALCTLRSLLQWSKCKNPTQEFTERKRRKTASDNLSTLYQIWNRLWEDYQSLFPLSLPSLKFYTMQYCFEDTHRHWRKLQLVFSGLHTWYPFGNQAPWIGLPAGHMKVHCSNYTIKRHALLTEHTEDLVYSDSLTMDE